MDSENVVKSVLIGDFEGLAKLRAMSEAGMFRLPGQETDTKKEEAE